MQLETWSRRKRVTPASKLLHRIHNRLQRSLPCLQLLAVGALCLVSGLLTGAWLHRHLGSAHIYCTSAPHFASSREDVACEAWAARQRSVVQADAEPGLPPHCRGIPYLMQVPLCSSGGTACACLWMLQVGGLSTAHHPTTQISQDLAPWMQRGIALSDVQAAAQQDGAARFVLQHGRLHSHRDYGATALHARYSYYVEFLHVRGCCLLPVGDFLGFLKVQVVFLVRV